MKPLLITGFGTRITVDKRRLIIHNKDKHLEFYPHQIDLDSIIIDGHTGNISFEAIRWLTKHDIPITVLNWDGNLLATINPKEPKNGKLRVNQYAKYLDDKTRYEIAYKIVDEKINQSYNLLNQLSNYYKELNIEAIDKAFADEKKIYESMLKKAKGQYDFNKLLMYEGKIALIYWNNLRLVYNKLYPEFNFQGRRNKSYSWNMNASDEINALLNYGYAILESETRKCINTVGLDLSVGYLHELAQSKTPLVYDLQELYRWIVDLSIIEMLEEKKLKKADFIVTENYHIRLREATAKTLIEKIQGNFNNKVSYKGKNYSYESIMLDNIQGLANFIVDKSDKLRFDIPSIRINRNDDKDLRDLLLKMTPDKRRCLGINRNTLWYIQKNLKEGKKIDLYDKVKSKITL
jgi:CRISPR-associated protein Cas1